MSNQLEVDVIDWTGSPAFTYQWTRDGVDIVGETASTYTTVPADDGAAIMCVVEAGGVAVDSDTKTITAV